MDNKHSSVKFPWFHSVINDNFYFILDLCLEKFFILFFSFDFGIVSSGQLSGGVIGILIAIYLVFHFIFVLNCVEICKASKLTNGVVSYVKVKLFIHIFQRIMFNGIFSLLCKPLENNQELWRKLLKYFCEDIQKI